MSSSGARPCRAEHVVSQGAEDVTVLLDVTSGEYYTVNEVAGLVWSLCDGSRTFDDLVDALCSEYDVSRDEVTVDVAELLEELHETGLLRA